MLSRVADSLFWMSRYMERTDSVLRILKISHQASQDNPDEVTWRPVLRLYTSLTSEQRQAMEKNSRAVMLYMVCDKENDNSVLNMVTRARENARGVQDNITKELWQSLNEFYHRIRDPQLEFSLRSEDPVSTLDWLIRQCVVYYGVSDLTMFRGEGLSFMGLGKSLERAIQTSMILEMKFSDISYDLDRTTDTTYWKHLLMSVSGYALYLKRYRSAFEARNVVDQTIFNVDFPRSILYALNQLHRYFGRLKSDGNREGFTKVDLMIGKVRSKVQYSDVESVSAMGLHNYLNELTYDLDEIARALNKYYFATS
ncbi:MAG TPA: alpha-E domain-containing protein [Cyclobacteriaceae bacterium]|nr:alpha-E domain-containing protein [Cyclobacteriaceae bacterium]